MSTFKRIDGDYTIQSINSTDKIVIDSKLVEISGNLEVSGNVTYVETSQLEVLDPFVLVNKSNTNAYQSNAGLLTHITSSTYAGIRYNSATAAWELSSNTDEDGTGGSWDAIGTAAASSPGGANTYVQFNAGGNTFGGEANFVYDSATNQVGLDGSIALDDQSTAPGNVANSTVIYGNTAGGGGTGIYFVDGSTSDELVSKSKAIVYGIIF